VPDNVIVEWVRALPGGPSLTVVSLLGRKPSGKDEYSFYSFFTRGSSLQRWLSEQDIGRDVCVVEHPTIDSTPIPHNVLDAIAGDILRLVAEGRTVVLMDSGGVQRVGQVCRHLRAIQIPDSG
jgi:hypothetical protein